MSGSNVFVSGSGIEIPPIVGDLYAQATFTSAAQGPFTLATGAPGIIVTRLFITVDPQSTQAASGNIVIQFKDTTANVVIGQIACYVLNGASAPTFSQLAPSASSGTGYYYRSRSANAVIQVSALSGGPLTAGSIRVAMNYAIINQDT